MSLGDRVKELRERLNLTQDQLAATVCVSRQTISNWETGLHTPKGRDVQPLARALRVSVGELYDEHRTSFVGSSGGSGQNEAYLGSSRAPEDPFNVAGRTDERRADTAVRLPIYRWGSLGDPRDHLSGPSPDREEFPPTGKESLIGPRGFGVEVRGDSMLGRGLHDGDVCWVNPDRAPQLGRVVLALVDDGSGESGMVVKSYEQSDVGDCLMSNYTDGKRLVVCRQFTVIGPVVWIERGFPPQ
jgi:transcriptional regulator with XRE-family HTH domain